MSLAYYSLTLIMILAWINHPLITLSSALLLIFYLWFKKAHYAYFLLPVLALCLTVSQSFPCPCFLDQPFLLDSSQSLRQGFCRLRIYQKNLPVGHWVKVQGQLSGQAQPLLNIRQGLKLESVKVVGRPWIWNFFYSLMIGNPLLGRIFFNEQINELNPLITVVFSSGSLLLSLFRKIDNKIKKRLYLFPFLLLVVYLKGFQFSTVRLCLWFCSGYLYKSIRGPFIFTGLLIFYPTAIQRLSFWIPFIYQVPGFLGLGGWEKKVKQPILVTSLFWFFHYQINVFSLIFYPVLLKLSWWILGLSIIFPNFIFSLLGQERDWFSQTFSFSLGQAPWLVVMLFLTGLLFVKNKKVSRTLLGVSIIFHGLFIFGFSGYKIIGLDVGQGDATLLIGPYQKEVIMIDTGPPSSWTKVKKSLARYGINKVDVLYISHHDQDHDGNQKALKQLFPNMKIVDHKRNHPRLEYFPFTYYLENKDYENKNDNSQVMGLDLTRNKFLWTGDAGCGVERDLLEEFKGKLDFFKLGHHGSSTSSCPYFLSRVSPRWVWISSDPRRYGHPHPSVLQSLKRLGIKFHQTSLDGDVIIFQHSWLSFGKLSGRWYFW